MMQRDCHGGKEMLTAKNDDDMWERDAKIMK